MISVLIPVYQQVVVDLVEAILSQLKARLVPFEIVVMDDCSEIAIRKANSALLQLQNVRYIELEKNVGRSTIRNFLASEAAYDLLLFLDCDVSLPDNYFIERYLNYSSKKHVTVGGIAYRNDPPSDRKKYFRWIYGQARESQPKSIRQQHPYASFKTANFCIDRSLFLKIRFSEAITGYGHEDTLFGLELARLKIPIYHIDNPIYHDGLEDAHVFISKSEEAVQNLLALYRVNPSDMNIERVALLKTFKRIKHFRLNFIFALTYSLAGQFMRQNLLGSHPSIFIFSLYKLCFFCHIYGRGFKSIGRQYKYSTL